MLARQLRRPGARFWLDLRQLTKVLSGVRFVVPARSTARTLLNGPETIFAQQSPDSLDLLESENSRVFC